MKENQQQQERKTNMIEEKQRIIELAERARLCEIARVAEMEKHNPRAKAENLRICLTDASTQILDDALNAIKRIDNGDKRPGSKQEEILYAADQLHKNAGLLKALNRFLGIR